VATKSLPHGYNDRADLAAARGEIDRAQQRIGCVATQRSITTSDALLTMLQVANHLRLIDHLLERMQERRGD